MPHALDVDVLAKLIKCTINIVLIKCKFKFFIKYALEEATKCNSSFTCSDCRGSSLLIRPKNPFDFVNELEDPLLCSKKKS